MQMHLTQCGRAVGAPRPRRDCPESLAVSGDQRNASARTCEGVWRAQAEHAAESLTKGARVLVAGRLRQRSWETDEGERRQVVEVEADEVAASLRFHTATLTKPPAAATTCSTTPRPARPALSTVVQAGSALAGAPATLHPPLPLVPPIVGCPRLGCLACGSPVGCQRLHATAWAWAHLPPRPAGCPALLVPPADLVYLVHLLPAYRHARHYLGFAERAGLPHRLREHATSDPAAPGCCASRWPPAATSPSPCCGWGPGGWSASSSSGRPPPAAVPGLPHPHPRPGGWAWLSRPLERSSRPRLRRH